MNGQTACADCHDQYARMGAEGTGVGRFARALFFGVRIGSGGVGGRACQVLAVAINFLAIVSTYIPFILEEIRNTRGADRSGRGGRSGDLVPVWQLDGSRGFRALSKSERFVVTAVAAGLFFWSQEGMLLLIALACGFQTFGATEEEGDRTTLIHFGGLLVALSVLTRLNVPL